MYVSASQAQHLLCADGCPDEVFPPRLLGRGACKCSEVSPAFDGGEGRHTAISY